jgi:hypothetical protein
MGFGTLFSCAHCPSLRLIACLTDLNRRTSQAVRFAPPGLYSRLHRGGSRFRYLQGCSAPQPVDRTSRQSARRNSENQLYLVAPCIRLCIRNYRRYLKFSVVFMDSRCRIPPLKPFHMLRVCPTLFANLLAAQEVAVSGAELLRVNSL